MSEHLIVLLPGTSKSVFEAARVRYAAKSALPPRLLIAELDDSALSNASASPRVETVLDSANASIPSSLSDSERLFVEAWKARQTMTHKQRRGEGAAWDAEGFHPPDRPKRP